jgi:gamma-glutamyltranspeptidase/glutathione hydrolase
LVARFPDATYLDRDARRDDPQLWSDSSARGMVVTAHYRATGAGVDILEAGGNAIDAAVAASLALAVCESAGSGLGGMAMMLLFDAARGKVVALEGPCRAPRRATPGAIASRRRYRGYAAVAVPSHVSVLQHAVERYGSLPARDLLGPAIGLADEGLLPTPVQRRLLEHYKEALRSGNAGHLFLDSTGEPAVLGSRFRQPHLAETLRRLAESGLDSFYRGAIAREIAADVEANGGFIRDDDLFEFPAPRESEALQTRLDDGQVLTMGPPAGGLALLQMLALERSGGWDLDPDTHEGAIALASIIRRVRQDRRRYRSKMRADGPGEAAELLTARYAAAACAEIVAAIEGRGETSHLCVADRWGNVVSMTQSIERSFGAAVATPSLGFLYNGYLRAFKIQNTRHPHYLRPGAPARSNAAPTLVVRDGRIEAALGSTGSERMTSGIFQVLMRLRRQSPFAAVHAPRLHCTPEGEVLLESMRFPAGASTALENAGFSLTPLDAYAFQMGGLQLLVRDRDRFVGVSEPRRDGAAAGPRS